MPPRPRPRQRIAARPPSAAATPEPAPLSQSSEGSRIASPPAVLVRANSSDNDNDSFFMRNRGPNAIKNLQKRVGLLATEPDDDDSPVYSESDYSEDENGRKRKRIKKPEERHKPLPAWTRQPNHIIPLDSDSDAQSEDDDIQYLDSTSSGPRSPKKKLKTRGRSRSRSPTPPPAIAQHQLDFAKSLARQEVAEAVAARESSPTFEGDTSMDNIQLAPELAAIANSIKNSRNNSRPGQNSHIVAYPSLDGPEIVQVRVKLAQSPGYLIMGHIPLTDLGVYDMKREETFTATFEKIARAAGLNKRNLVMTHDWHQVFPTSCPAALPKVIDELELVASDKATYEVLRVQRVNSLATPSLTQDDLSSHNGGLLTPQIDIPMRTPSIGPSQADEPEIQPQEVSDSDEPEETLMKIRLRSERFPKEKVVQVKPTTLCSSILTHYLKFIGLEGKLTATQKGKIKLSFDGDTLAPGMTAAEADLDDDVQVEVVGLPAA